MQQRINHGQDLEGATPYSFRNKFVLSELHGMKKRITLPQLTENGLVKRRGYSSGSIMARTLQGCKTVQLL
ncbi:hypothetical protein AABM27_11955 [Heyndrickxia faecalis]|uniref:hypothetical protein n=1 Tax=Heyndrickxia faecalis TaxID=2824910 RepID=UPI00310978A1